MKFHWKIDDIFGYFSIENRIVNFLILENPSKFGKSPDVWQLFSSINSSKHFGFSPTIQKLHVVARKPLRTAPFIALQVVHTKIALTWKILGFIAWRPHIIFTIKRNITDIQIRIWTHVITWNLSGFFQNQSRKFPKFHAKPSSFKGNLEITRGLSYGSVIARRW